MSFTYTGPFVSPTIAVGILNDCWNLATAKSTDLDNKINTALSTLGSAPTMTAAAASPLPSITEPSITIPAIAAGPDIELFRTYNTETMDKLVTLFGNYITTYFPADNATNAYVESLLQSWLNGTQTSVESQLYENDRSRILAESVRAQDEAIAVFAARGFPLPPGAAAAAIVQITQTAQDKLAQSSREVAFKMLDNIRFAVQNAIQLRQVALSTAGEYIRSLASGLQSAQAMAISQSESQNHLIQAAAAYLNARSNAAETVFKARATNAGFTQEAAKLNQATQTQYDTKQADIVVAAAQAVAHEAAALFNNLHTSVGVSGSETIA